MADVCARTWLIRRLSHQGSQPGQRCKFDQIGFRNQTAHEFHEQQLKQHPAKLSFYSRTSRTMACQPFTQTNDAVNKLMTSFRWPTYIYM